MSAFNDMAQLLNPSSYDVATEAIDFQIDTAFADGIRDVYQDIINYRESCRGDKKIVKKVLDYADKKMDKEFTRLFKQHLNLTLGHISLSNSITFMFAMQPIMGSDRTLGKIVDAMTGNSLYSSSIDFSNKTLEEIKKISMSIDKKKGRVGATTFLKKAISMNFFFDPYVGFLMKDTISIHLDYFTAEELTAITLHEVGHMMSLLEHCGDTFFRISLNMKLIQGLQSAPISEKMKLAREMLNDKDLSRRLSENSGLNQKEADAATQTLKNMSDNFERHKDDNWNDSSWSFWTTILSFFVNMYIVAQNIILTIFNPFAEFLYTYAFILAIELGRDYVKKGGGNNPKYSDFMANSNTAFNWERWADEYVTRYGYGSHLNNALTKLFNSIKGTNLFQGSNEKGMDTWIRNSACLLYLSFFMSTFNAIMMGGNLDDGCGIYESQIDRLKRVIQDTANVFKRMDLPQEVMDRYILEYENCKKSLDNVSAGRKAEHYLAIFRKIFMSFADPIQLGNRLIRGNIKAEYADLANQIDELKANGLYYNAAKINSIISKRG